MSRYRDENTFFCSFSPKEDDFLICLSFFQVRFESGVRRLYNHLDFLQIANDGRIVHTIV